MGTYVIGTGGARNPVLYSTAVRFIHKDEKPGCREDLTTAPRTHRIDQFHRKKLSDLILTQEGGFNSKILTKEEEKHHRISNVSVWEITFLKGISQETSTKASQDSEVDRDMYQGFPGGFDSGSRDSSSPSAESQYLSSVDSFASPPTTTASQECTAAVSEMPGSFLPTVTAITTSQDLQWMVQPTLISSVAPQQPQAPVAVSHQGPLVDPYDQPSTSYSAGYTPPSAEAPGPSRPTRARTRRPREETLTPEEEEKRRVRRERNKLAAAKCRNRRRDLTDRLQSETDQLEEEKAELEAEISELHKEKERLEFMLVAHQPTCKIPFEEQQQQQQQQQQQGPEQHQLAGPSVSILGLSVKEDPFYLPPAYLPPPHEQLHHPSQQGLISAEVAFSSSFYAHSEPGPNPCYTSSFVFSYPEGGGTCGASVNQRTSSSEQSSDSLSSPSLLAL